MESDLDEDVDKEINDPDTEFFGNDELDYNCGSVANPSDTLVPAANSATWRWRNTDKPSEKVQCEHTGNIFSIFFS